MNLTCNSRHLKCLIFILNFLLMGSGISLIVVASIMRNYYFDYASFVYDDYMLLSHLLILTGCLIFVICFLGCFVIIRNSGILMLVFLVLFGIVIIFEIYAGIAGYILRSKTYKYLHIGMKKSMPMYYRQNHEITATWDLVQTQFECCGVTDFDDWLRVHNRHDNVSLPISCCPSVPATGNKFICNINSNYSTTIPTSTVTTTKSNPMTTEPDLDFLHASTDTATQLKENNVHGVLEVPPSTTPHYQMGCERVFGKWVRSLTATFGILCLTLAGSQMIGVGIACLLSIQLRNTLKGLKEEFEEPVDPRKSQRC